MIIHTRPPPLNSCNCYLLLLYSIYNFIILFIWNLLKLVLLIRIVLLQNNVREDKRAIMSKTLQARAQESERSLLFLLTFYSSIYKRFNTFKITCLVGYYSTDLSWLYFWDNTPTKIMSYNKEVGFTDTQSLLIVVS